MTVEILAGSVIAHRRPRVSMAGRDLHVAQIHARVEHGRDERVWSTYVDESDYPDFAASANRRSRRMAACRSIRVPWLSSRTGPEAR